MNIHAYLIEHRGFDWRKLCANWHWRLPGKFTVWMMNRFGDLFIKMDDGRILCLRLEDGSLECLAQTKDEFCTKLDDEEIANDWLLIPLVDSLVAAGKILKEGECYAFVQLPLLGGEYDVGNIVVRTVEFQYAALGPIHEQLKDVPDGTSVSFKFTE